MKDKKLKKLMNEYASLPRTDMDKDMAKRTDSVDVIVGPADEPSRRHPVRNYWARVAVGAAFAVVAAVAIPVAVALAPRAADKAAVGGNYASESANHADASIREGEGGQAGSIDGEVRPADTYTHADIDELKLLASELYRPYYDGTYEDARSTATLDPDVLAIADGVGCHATIVKSDQGEVLIIGSPASLSTVGSSPSAPRFEIVVYPDYEGPLYRNASVTQSAAWRGITVEYEAGKCIEIRFVTDGVYYYVKFVPQSGEEMTVQDVLDYLFA